MAGRYLDKSGKEIFVAAGLGGAEFGTFWAGKGGGKYRVVSKALPMRDSEGEAQGDLDRYAKVNKLRRR